MAHIISRNSRFYVVAYHGVDPELDANTEHVLEVTETFGPADD